MKTILKLIVLIVLVVYLLWPAQDNLDTQSQALVSKTQYTDGSSAWFYLLGFKAQEGVDPLDVGRSRFDAFAQAEAAIYGSAESPFYVDKPYYVALHRQPSPLDCAIYEKVCRDGVLQKHDGIAQYLDDNNTWLSRYNTFIAMRDFKSLSNPARHPSVQDYTVLLHGNRMVGLEALSKAINGNPEKAHAQLKQNIENIRAQLKASDNLSHKLMMTVMFMENIDYLSVINALPNAIQGPVINPLTAAERDFDLAFSYEFRLIRKKLNAMFEKQAYGTVVGRIYDGALRLFFKPGMTANLLRQDMQYSSSLAKLSHAELKSAVNTKREHTVTWQDYVFNLIGTYSTTQEMLDHTNKISLVFDLDAKVQLYNHMYGPENQQGMEALFTFVNPYYERTDFIRTDLENNQVCFDGLSTGLDSSQCVLYTNRPFAVSLL